MKISTCRPEHVCWLFVPLIVLIGVFTFRQTLDVQIHDTYLVIASVHLALGFGLTLGFTGLGYWIERQLKGNLSNTLSWINITLTLGSILLMLILIFFAESDRDYRSHKYLNMGSTLAISGFIFSQPVYLINLIVGLTSRKT